MLSLLSPHFFKKFSRAALPYLIIGTVITLAIGLYQALFISPPDYQQGENVRIMYVHVPSAWLALGIYSFIAICSFSYLVWQTAMSYILAFAAAPIGTVFALITLITGSLWGKPIWGTWWVWDARLTSMLVLFLLYVSFIIIAHSGHNQHRASKPACVIALIGFINVPIVKFSVNIWYSLHQPASMLRLGSPTIHKSMLSPLIIMFIGFIMFFLLNLLMRANYILNNRSKNDTCNNR